MAVNLDRISPDDRDDEVQAETLDKPADAIEHAYASSRREAGGQRHQGEEGKMGRPSSKSKSGLYAMKGPKTAIVQLAAPSVGSDDEDVWGGLTGTEVGESFGVGGLGLVGSGRGGGGTGEGTIGLGNIGLIGKGGGGGTGSGYGRGAGVDFGAQSLQPSGSTQRLPRDLARHTGFIAVADDAKSTFSIDVDTASYSSVRRSLMEGSLPQPDSVRLEELVNYFDYDYAAPTGDAPFSVTAEVGDCPWNPEHRLVHVGLQGKVIADEDLPPRNLVFLVDVSGSMHSPDKLPLVRQSLAALTETLRAEDRISVVTYAGSAGTVLSPTSGADKDAILLALGQLESGGGTNGAAGIVQAYALAQDAFITDGVNRVIMATDGDFNVGLSSHDALVELIEAKRKTGVELSVLGYGMGYSDHTMEQLADKGNGNYAYIDGPEEARKVLVEEAGGTLVTIAKDVKIQVQLDPARVRSYRLIGYDNRRLAHEDFTDDTKDAGEIGAGHTVTALYEVVPAPDADADVPWMTVGLRYKPPQGDVSRGLSLPVVADARALEQTSDDFRFSAAVASFGMLLQGTDAPGAGQEPGTSYASTRELAVGALGEDPSCRRHHFVELVRTAGQLAGEAALAELAPRPTCVPRPARPSSPTPSGELPSEVDRADDAPSVTVVHVSQQPDRFAMLLEILRLLPPLLALPLFVMGLRPRRRRGA